MAHTSDDDQIGVSGDAGMLDDAEAGDIMSGDDLACAADMLDLLDGSGVEHE